jgi:hypothetical protein
MAIRNIETLGPATFKHMLTLVKYAFIEVKSLRPLRLIHRNGRGVYGYNFD